MNMIQKTFLPLILAVTVLTSGCSEKTDSGHEDHMTGGQDQHMQHEAKASGKKTAQIFEGGRIVMFEETPPAINLIDQDGKRVTNEDLKGKVTLINFIYTRCDESCPVMVHKFMDIAKEMKDELGKNLQLVSITMDPEHDSPEILKSYAKKIDVDTTSWSFLTEKKDIVDKVLKGFNFFYQKNEDGGFGHGNAIVMLDKNGVWKYNFNVLTVQVDILVERLKKEF